MSIHINVGGVWKDLTGTDGPRINVASTWKTPDSVHINVGGVWKEVWTSTVYDLSGMTGSYYTDEGGVTQTYSVVVYFRTDATIDVVRNVTGSNNDIETYVVPTSESANLYVRATNVSGQVLNVGDAAGSWHSLATQRSFGISYTSSGGFDQVSGVKKFELATDSGGTNIVATSSNITITVGESF